MAVSNNILSFVRWGPNLTKFECFEERPRPGQVRHCHVVDFGRPREINQDLCEIGETGKETEGTRFEAMISLRVKGVLHDVEFRMGWVRDCREQCREKCARFGSVGGGGESDDKLMEWNLPQPLHEFDRLRHSDID